MQNKHLFYHSTPVQIRFNDIDIMGHVNNSIYQNYFDIARTKYFEEVFEKKLQWNIRSLVLVKITIEYISSIIIDESIKVDSKVYKIGNKSLRMTQQIVNSDSQEVKAINDAILVAFSYQNNESILMPREWREKIKVFEKDIVF